MGDDDAVLRGQLVVGKTFQVPLSYLLMAKEISIPLEIKLPVYTGKQDNWLRGQERHIVRGRQSERERVRESESERERDRQ